MSGLDEEDLVSKFRSCTGTQEGIEIITQFILFYKNYAEEIVNIWKRECQNAPLKRILIYFYIANDVIQNARKKTHAFTEPFYNAFHQLFEDGLLVKCDKQIKNSIMRVLQILETRGCFTPAEVMDLRQTITRAAVCFLFL